MTARKDYERTARILRAARLACYLDDAGLEAVAVAFGIEYAQDNPRFSAARFLFAAGVDKATAERIAAADTRFKRRVTA